MPITGRADFGGTAADFTTDPNSPFFKGKAGSLTFWSAQTGGTQYTDLVFGGQSTTLIGVPRSGNIPVFQGPPGVAVMWAEDGVAATGRVAIVAMVAIATGAEAAAAEAVAAKVAAQAVPTTTDGLVAGAIDDQASLTRARLTAATVYQVTTLGSPRPRSPRFGALGHSIIAAGDGMADTYSDSIQHMAAAMSGGRLDLVRNAGVGGQNSNQILARFDTDVLPHNLGVLFIMAYTNDYAAGISAATSQANHIALIDKCRTNGIVPIMSTTTPFNTATDAQKAAWRAFDRWLRTYCAANRVLLVDSWSKVVDPSGDVWPNTSWTTGGTGGAADGLHPTNLGNRAIATELVSILPADWPRAERLAQHNVRREDENLIFNPLMLNDANSDGLADNWSDYVTPPASKVYTITTPANGRGKMQRVTLDEAGSGDVYLRQQSFIGAAQFNPGDVWGVACRMTIEDTALTEGKVLLGGLQVLNGGGTGNATQTHTAFLGVGRQPGRSEGVVKHEQVIIGTRFTARAGIAFIDVLLTLKAGAASGAIGGKGYAEFGQVRLLNLTRAGLV